MRGARGLRVALPPGTLLHDASTGGYCTQNGALGPRIGASANTANADPTRVNTPTTTYPHGGGYGGTADGVHKPLAKRTKLQYYQSTNTARVSSTSTEMS